MQSTKAVDRATDFLVLMREGGDIWLVSLMQCKKIHSFASPVGEDLEMYSVTVRDASAIRVNLSLRAC
jgi:hypothetical protein